MNTISPLAFVHPNAKIGDNNIIGPFCYIDDNTVIGDNNKLLNSITLAHELAMETSFSLEQVFLPNHKI